MRPVLFFDYDGTIHQALDIYETAVRDTVDWLNDRYTKEYGIGATEMPTRERMRSWLGMNAQDMWQEFAPQIDTETRNRAIKHLGDIMIKLTLDHQASWYDGMEQTIDALSREGYRMAVISNCTTEYAKAHWKAFGMFSSFFRFYDCESFGNIPKSEILQRVYFEPSAKVESLIMIGDRGSDLEAARAAEAPFVACRYGYGTPEELEGADYYVDSPSEILKAIDALV